MALPGFGAPTMQALPGLQHIVEGAGAFGSPVAEQGYCGALHRPGWGGLGLQLDLPAKSMEQMSVLPLQHPALGAAPQLMPSGPHGVEHFPALHVSVLAQHSATFPALSRHSWELVGQATPGSTQPFG